MTTITAPLTTITLQGLVPDVVRSCIVQQPSPPPDPGETPPGPITGEGIYTPVAPGVTYEALPTVSIVDTSPDQMIGCIIDTADNPQGRLNALFPSAIDGDGVIERSTNDIWVFDGTTWNNVGPTPGPTIVTATVVPPWNEIVVYDARVRTRLEVNGLAYALELLTEPAAYGITLGLTVRSVTALVAVPTANVTLAAGLPAVIAGNRILVPAVNLTATANAPAISSGASISMPASNTNLTAYAPTVFDDDAWTYIVAVESADTQALEQGVRIAINTFVVGCKSDGIWNAIKSSCILAGARTLTGALVPLKGTAPTNLNFVSGDYSRETGLVGDGSTKYLDSNRANNADPQNNCHISVYASTFGATTATVKIPLGRQINGFNEKAFFASTSINSGLLSVRCQSTNAIVTHTASRTNGLIGASRSSSSTISIRNNNSTVTASQTSTAPSTPTLFVFASSDGINPNNGGSAAFFDDSRLAFYSIGESLDLALLDNRVTQLVADIDAAI